MEALSKQIHWSTRGDKVWYGPADGPDQPPRTSEAQGRIVIAMKRGATSSSGYERAGEGFERFTRDDPILPALTHVQREVNARIGYRCPPRLLWGHDGRLGLHQIPPNLLQMLWLQFADSLTGRFAYRPCHVCRRWMRIGPDASRKSRLYCSSACRTQGLRLRREEAHKLHEEGKAIAEIAEELGCDARAVARWVKKLEGGDD